MTYGRARTTIHEAAGSRLCLRVAIPFGLALANKGFAAVLDDPHLRAGLNVHRGRLTYRAVAESLGLPFSPIPAEHAT
jgi:alanine dehydrogenase